MADYRLHFLDCMGRVEAEEIFRATDDFAAVEKAMASTDPRSIELWDGARLVRFVHGLTTMVPPSHRAESDADFAKTV